MSDLATLALYRDEIARLRRDRDDYRLAASVEAGERRRAHARVAELEAEVARLRAAIKQEEDDTREMASVASPEAASCLECVADCLSALYHSRPASSPTVKAGEGS